jgi:hypothetical protein
MELQVPVWIACLANYDSNPNNTVKQSFAKLTRKSIRQPEKDFFQEFPV